MDLPPNKAEKLLYNGINIAETAYSWLPFEHKLFIAKQSVFLFYADDFCDRDPEPIRQFAGRFTRGEKQLDPVLDWWVDLMKDTDKLWPAIGASSIISGTMDFLYATYLEATTQGLKVDREAKRYPWFIRARSGYGVTYGQFIFPKYISEDIVSYVQMLP